MTQLWTEVEERRLFHTFRTITSNHFSVASSTSFWSSLVLQACHAHSSIRQAALALASLHEGFISQLPDRDQNKRMALQFYGQALEETRNSLSVKDQPTIVTVISCVLLSYFESMRGQLENAITHLRSGLHILSSHATIMNSTGLLSVLRIFTRAGFQANYFVDNSNHAQLVAQSQSLRVPHTRPALDLEDLQTSLYSCLNESMFSGQKQDSVADLVSLGTNYHMAQCAQLILQGSDSPSFLSGREKATSSLKQWQRGFHIYLRGQDEAGIELNKPALTLLKLHHLVATMMLASDRNLSTEQTGSDTDSENFEKIINWSRSLLIGKAALPALMPDVGVIAPLFFVATKNPESKLRDQAMKILESNHRREGIWDSKVAVKIINEIIHLNSGAG
jgi:hypothetical protein